VSVFSVKLYFHNEVEVVVELLISDMHGHDHMSEFRVAKKFLNVGTSEESVYHVL
jgi:hypothetical protein